ncbi:MAG: ATP-binding protein [Bacillota bacterium]
MDDLRSDVLRALCVVRTPFFVVSYPELRFVFSNSATDKEIIAFLSGPEVNYTGEAFDRVFSGHDRALTIKRLLIKVAREKKAERADFLKLTDPGGVDRFFHMEFTPVFSDEGDTIFVAVFAMACDPPGEGAGRKDTVKTGLTDILCPVPDNIPHGAIDMERELQKARITLKTVLDSSQSIIIITDSESKVVACSRTGLEIFEIVESEIIGERIQDVLKDFKFESKEIQIGDINSSICLDKVEVRITTRRGKVKTLLMGSNPSLDQNGEIIGAVVVGADITSLIEKQEKIIENERLAVIGQLTSGIAHEIKNPLTVISGFAEVTKNKIEIMSSNEKLKEAILYYQQEIIDNCRSMNRLIVDLLQLARPRKTEKVKVNLAQALDKICNTISAYALQKNVLIVKDLTAADLEVDIDPVQIRQVLLNLFNNSIQAMGGGGVLRISTESSNGYLVIRVSDNGSGIRPEDLSKLGTPFFTTKAEGTGLGLSLTYSIIREHGGRIDVESEVGKGTVFKIFLPVMK